MTTKQFKIVYHPFPTSDLTAEMLLDAIDEEEAVKLFRENYPLWSLKSVESA